MNRMNVMGRAMVVLALMGSTTAWGQGLMDDSPVVSPGWHLVNGAGAMGGSCYLIKNRVTATKEAASWHLTAPATGDYQIQIHVPAGDHGSPATRNAMYII